MKVVILLCLLCVSCVKDPELASALDCPSSKALFSSWSTGDNSGTIDLSGGAYDQLVIMAFGDPVTYWDGSANITVNCYTPRGDVLMVISENNRVEFRPCSNDSTLDFASYDISCNILNIKYDSDGSVESYQ